MPRYFTLAEARAMLPLAGRALREAVQAKERYEEAEKHLQEIVQQIMMRGGMAIDTQVAESWKTQREMSAANLKRAVESITEAGVLIKDLETGLIDFPTLFHGREVYLCWRMDEADIEHWHGINDGFAGRQPIDQDFLENHQGGEDED